MHEDISVPCEVVNELFKIQVWLASLEIFDYRQSKQVLSNTYLKKFSFCIVEIRRLVRVLKYLNFKFWYSRVGKLVVPSHENGSHGVNTKVLGNIV